MSNTISNTKLTVDFNVEVVLVEPEIPPNTGSIARICAALGCRLHLIEPLGFSLSDRHLRRAGLDYWHLVDVKCHPNLETFFKTNPAAQCFYFSKKARRSYHEADYRGRSYLFFGKESYGLPDRLIDEQQDHCYRIPMRTGARSINLSNAVSVVIYEAFRQNSFPGLV
ncbi:MAG: tRNA (cytidine(34)-2'-O)-methyltransferase [bacterium]|nr:tRNA (cytidine(34)-2'-O)-methyltransferase [bacterium]